MADYVERYSDKASDELEKQIRQVYKQAAEEVQKKLDDFIRGHKARNAQMLQMVSDGKMSKQDYQKWMRGQVFQGDQWKQKLKDVTDVYVHADEKAREIVGGTSKNVFMEAANYTAYDLEKGMRGAVAFNVYDAKTVERLLKDDPKMLPEWKIDQPKDYKWNEKRVRNAVTQGIIQGESVKEVGDRLTGELATSNAAKMDMFARTAINGAQNAGRMDRLHEAEEMGIEIRKKWLATLDQRTRDTHQALDGQEQPVDEPFVVDGMKIDYPGDPFAPPELSYNCRCTLTYVYPKYQHLQHNHERRDQLNDKNIENMTYYEWVGLASKNDRKQEGESGSKQEEKKKVSYYKPIETLDGLDSAEIERVNNRFQNLDSKYHAKVDGITTTLERDQKEYDLFFETRVKYEMEQNPKMRRSTAEKRTLEMMGPRPSADPNAPGWYERITKGGDFNLEDRTMTINTLSVFQNGGIDGDIEHRKKAFERNERRIKEGRTPRTFSNVGTSFESVFIHEYGHAIDAEYGVSEHPLFVKFYSGLTDAEKISVSDYATTNKQEFIAEAFLEGFMGETQGDVSKRFMKVLEEIIK